MADQYMDATFPFISIHCAPSNRSVWKYYMAKTHNEIIDLKKIDDSLRDENWKQLVDRKEAQIKTWLAMLNTEEDENEKRIVSPPAKKLNALNRFLKWITISTTRNSH